ncbi:MAG: hypothetical protein HC921_19125 [Synechococcaceae cyanobacterium SM2_3_1]|nr:hypothetical protein [Synechococcaceae cyanobacterium SM2_3_1]
MPSPTLPSDRTPTALSPKPGSLAALPVSLAKQSTLSLVLQQKSQNIVRQIHDQLPQAQQALHQSLDALPGYWIQLRDAHHHKSGKQAVRGLLTLSGALALFDLSLLTQV